MSSKVSVVRDNRFHHLLPLVFAAVAILSSVGCHRQDIDDCFDPGWIRNVELDAAAAKIFWRLGFDVESPDFDHYNIYAFLDSTLTELAGDNDSLWDYLVGSTAGKDTTIEIGFDPKYVWFVQIRSANGKGQVGDHEITQPYVALSPRPCGRSVKIYGWSANANSNTCFVFSTGEVLDTMPANFARADIYLDVYRTTSGYAAAATPPYFHNRGYRRTKIKQLAWPYADIKEMIEIYDRDWTAGDSIGVRVNKGWTYAFVCSDSTFAKIRVDSVYVDSVTPSNSFIIFDYAWQNVKGFNKL